MISRALRSPYFWFGLLLSYNLTDQIVFHARTPQARPSQEIPDRRSLTIYPGP